MQEKEYLERSQVWANVVQTFVPPVLDKINLIEFVDNRFEQYSNKGEQHSDEIVYITNCLTQPEPDFWTLIRKYNSIEDKFGEDLKMKTEHWLFWYDAYFPNLAGTRDDNTDLIQKSCKALLENGTLQNEEFEKLFAQYCAYTEALL
tara:strand:- start:1336 stop:1776 length:441 start_codon:yes stop_codon:yes gene_type:complete